MVPQDDLRIRANGADPTIEATVADALVVPLLIFRWAILCSRSGGRSMTGTFVFGLDATADRLVGWDDGRGNWVTGQMNYFINEFRGPWTFAVLRYALPEASIRNAGFKIKPYRYADGRDTYALAAWEGSAFQLLGLSLFMQELMNPGWRRSLETLVDIELGGLLTLHLPICGDCTRLGMHIGAVASARLNKPD